MKFNNSNNIYTEHMFDKLKYYSFNIFDDFPNLVNGYTTRHGGVSKGYVGELNFSDTVGDSPENLIFNFDILGKAIGIDKTHMICSDQTHTNNILIVDESHLGQGVIKPREFHDIDGLITNIPGICLVTTYADCVPLYFYDPVNKVIAMSHSGWKGTVNRIAQDTIVKLRDNFNSKPEDLICAIGPSICMQCYEVSEDVIEQFMKSFDSKYYDMIFYSKENNKYQLDLNAACKITLLENGVLESNISLNNICTCCNPSDFHSHRASHGKRGNNAGFLCLK